MRNQAWLLTMHELIVLIIVFPPYRLLTNSFDEITAFQRALKSYIASIDTVYAKQHEEFHVGFEGR